MTKPQSYRKSEEYGWEILVDTYIQENPKRLYFGKIILRMKYQNIKDGLEVKVEKSFDKRSEAETELESNKLYNLLCAKVHDNVMQSEYCK